VFAYLLSFNWAIHNQYPVLVQQVIAFDPSEKMDCAKD